MKEVDGTELFLSREVNVFHRGAQAICVCTVYFTLSGKTKWQWAIAPFKPQPSGQKENGTTVIECGNSKSSEGTKGIISTAYLQNLLHFTQLVNVPENLFLPTDRSAMPSHSEGKQSLHSTSCTCPPVQSISAAHHSALLGLQAFERGGNFTNTGICTQRQNLGLFSYRQLRSLYYAVS